MGIAMPESINLGVWGRKMCWLRRVFGARNLKLAKQGLLLECLLDRTRCGQIRSRSPRISPSGSGGGRGVSTVVQETLPVRFRIDGQDGGVGQPDYTTPDATPALLDRRQCLEFLKLVHDGLGRTMACAQIGVCMKNLKHTLAKRPSFRGALEQVEQVRADNLFSVLYEAALRGDTRAAQFLLTRHDRIAAQPAARPKRADES